MERLVEIELPDGEHAGVAARRAIERHVDAKVAPRVLSDAKLIATELAANAVRHGSGAVRMRLCMSAGTLRIEMIDGGSGAVPRIREQPGDATGGFGLRIVDAMSERWGAFEGTTHVWAELPLRH